MQLNIKYPGVLSGKALCKMLEATNDVEKARKWKLGLSDMDMDFIM